MRFSILNPLIFKQQLILKGEKSCSFRKSNRQWDGTFEKKRYKS